MTEERTIISQGPFSYLKDINLGIILIGIFFIFEFGSFQGLYPIINKLRLPFIVSLLIIFYALFLIMTKQIDFSSETTRKFTFLCLFIVVYAIISTRNPIAKVDIVKIFLLYLANYLIITACIHKPSQFFLLIDVWLVSILFSSFHGVMQGGLVWGNRWLKDENHISLVAAIAIPFAFVFLKEYRYKIKKLFYLICLTFFIAVNVVGASRGGALSMMLVAFLCLCLMKNKFRNFILITLGIIFILNFAPPRFFSEMESLKQGAKEGTAADRIFLWRISFKVFSDHPIIGVGPMNHTDYLAQYGGYRSESGSVQVVHSTPIQWLTEKGIVGTIILLIFLISMYKNWKVAFSRQRVPIFPAETKNLEIFKAITHACGISQAGFWLAACFLSLLPYPFYWCLVPFSEAWKNLFLDYIYQETGREVV